MTKPKDPQLEKFKEELLASIAEAKGATKQAAAKAAALAVVVKEQEDQIKSLTTKAKKRQSEAKKQATDLLISKKQTEALEAQIEALHDALDAKGLAYYDDEIKLKNGNDFPPAK